MPGWIRRPSPGTVLGMIALLVALGSVAGASIPSANSSITGCYNKKTGLLRVIDKDAGQACTPGEAEILIASVDSTGNRLRCPAGSTLFLGVCFGQQARTAANHIVASNDCNDEGKRLPSEGEMRAFVDLPGVTASGFEWTDELSDTDVESTFLYAVAGESGSAVSAATDPQPYRCVGGPLG